MQRKSTLRCLRVPCYQNLPGDENLLGLGCNVMRHEWEVEIPDAGRRGASQRGADQGAQAAPKELRKDILILAYKNIVEMEVRCLKKVSVYATLTKVIIEVLVLL